jgi:phosphohistidine phosphatase
MKTLFFNRHAKSDWSDSSLSDFDRPLNKRGMRDAPVMGKRLKERGESIDLFVSSPAVRAITTARIMAENYGYPVTDIKQVERLYLPSTHDFMNSITELDDALSSAIVFAHNPGITEIVEYLSGTSIGNMPTCGIAKIEFPSADAWKEVSGGLGNLEFFDFPKKEFP